jgi:hypothetical protein
MNRKDQLREIPYPVDLFGDSPVMRQRYALALEIAEHWETFPKTRAEQEAMIPSLPKHLRFRALGIHQSMVQYIQDQLREMEVDDNLS